MGLLHAGICSVSAGVAALTLAVVVESVATYAPAHIGNGLQPKRLNISIFEAQYFDDAAYRGTVGLQFPDSAASPTVMQKFEVVPASSPEEPAYSAIEERFSFDGQSASFQDRFGGAALRLASLGSTVMGLSSGQYGAVAVLEQSGSSDSSTSSAIGGPSVASSAPRNPRLSARASANNANRGGEARQASLTLSMDNQSRTAIY